ncbi:hypothetical protein B0J11DRAFT_435127 [Dendryphion nanum]|uniref:Asl1-like glycosyl hydrolase catalytic domain-containing protein n=1 Tax=Dendryphion nanum TaxID=256645 RepID=A0A9P9DUG9_9PLEO|nr:hypothetical protein B0J11DRAFT_435127 [Dendryphion nanum]
MAKLNFLLSLLGASAVVNASPIVARASGKRGLAYNEGPLTKLFPNGKVSWMYNWDSVSNGASGLNFVPMLHSDLAVHTSRWNANLEKSVKAGSTHVFSFNEPDQCGGGGACMQDVGRTVAAHKQWVQPIAQKYPNLKIGAPAVTNGVKDGATGKAMGIPYLKSFLAGCQGCKIDFVVAHWYDSGANVEYFKKHLQDVYEAGGKRNVWLTEFAPTSGDPQAFLRQVLPWLDAQPWLTHYAYQWAAPGVLVNGAKNGLTPLGSTYATV